jgi:hypothetical protein
LLQQFRASSETVQNKEKPLINSPSSQPPPSREKELAANLMAVRLRGCKLNNRKLR